MFIYFFTPASLQALYQGFCLNQVVVGKATGWLVMHGRIQNPWWSKIPDANVTKKQCQIPFLFCFFFFLIYIYSIYCCGNSDFIIGGARLSPALTAKEPMLPCWDLLSLFICPVAGDVWGVPDHPFDVGRETESRCPTAGDWAGQWSSNCLVTEMHHRLLVFLPNRVTCCPPVVWQWVPGNTEPSVEQRVRVLFSVGAVCDYVLLLG